MVEPYGRRTRNTYNDDQTDDQTGIVMGMEHGFSQDGQDIIVNDETVYNQSQLGYDQRSLQNVSPLPG